MNKYATVSDMIKTLSQLEEEGYGDYVLTCNKEYYLAKVGDVPLVSNYEKGKDVL